MFNNFLTNSVSTKPQLNILTSDNFLQFTIFEGGVYDNNFREVESIGDNISGISTMDAETVFHNEDNVANNVEKLRNSQNVEDITFSSRHVAKYVDKHQISDTMTRQLLKL